jgi:hypothetical protein
MPDITLILGPVAFENFEVPAEINFGGAQRLVVHRLAGGGRVIDSLGRDDADIRFSGVFSGADAMVRAQTLDELRAAGLPLPLTWDVLYYTVLIREFKADYRNGWWIPYCIVCSVLRDEASSGSEVVASLASGLVSDAASAVIQAASVGIDISPIEAILSAPGVTTRNSTNFVGAQRSLASSRSVISGAMGSAESSLAGLDFGRTGSADDGINRLTAALGASNQLAALSTANGYLGRAAINLDNTST